MKKLLFTFLACISSIVGYTQSITGNIIVCPKQSYTYTYTLPGSATKDIIVTIFINNGTISNNPQANYTIKKGESKFTFNVIWNDIATSFAQIDAHTNDGVTQNAILNNITIASMSNIKPTYFASTPAANNGIIKIPLGQTGVLNMTVNDFLYYLNLNNNPTYKITDYRWTVGTQSTEAKNKYAINYGVADLNQTLVSITPVGNACSKSYGGSISYTIQRFFDIQIKSNSGSVTCPNNNVSFSLQGTIPQGSTIEWIAADNFTLVSGQGTTNAIFRTGSTNSTATVKAKITYPGFSETLQNSEVWVGVPETPSGVSGFSNGKNFNFNSLYSLSAYESKGATEYIWSITDGGEIRKYDVNGNRNVEMYTSINVGWNQTKSFSLRVSARNKCGTSGERALTGYVTFSGPGGIDEFSLRSATIELEPEIKSVKVYNLSGVLVYSDNAVNGSFDIKSTVLNDGIYIIEKFDGENRTSEKVILKR